MSPILRLLADYDLSQAVCSLVTREQAGLLLAPACRAAAALVRAEDATYAASQREVWCAAPPAWNLTRIQSHIAQRHAHAETGVELVLKDFATQLDMLSASGAVAHHFDRAAALAGRPTAFVGCHELSVLDPLVFLHAMRAWTSCTQRRAFATASCRLFAGRTGSHYVLNLEEWPKSATFFFSATLLDP
jgi:hypothetical protein